MVEKASITGRVRHRTLRSVPEEAQRGQRTLNRLRARHPRTLDRDRIAGKHKSHPGDAGWDVMRGGVVGNQPVLTVRFAPEISEGVSLQILQLRVTVRSHGTPGSTLLH